MIRPRITEEAGLKTLVIAEAGVNHNGDLKLAHQLIDVAADAGADLVKFQTFSADRLVTSLASKADYLGVSSLKIPSGEITNLPYLRHVGRFGKPVILSTGLATLGEIEAALESPGLSAKSATRGSDPPCA